MARLSRARTAAGVLALFMALVAGAAARNVLQADASGSSIGTAVAYNGDGAGGILPSSDTPMPQLAEEKANDTRRSLIQTPVTEIPASARPLPEAASANNTRRALLQSCSDRLNCCGSWRDSGYCGSQWVYEGQSVRDVWCRAACGTCSSGGSSCSDQDGSCPSWASQGYCDPKWYVEEPSKTVRDFWCRRSCNTCGSSGGGGSGGGGSGSDEMLAAVNAERSRRGLRALQLDGRLMRAAQKHSEYQRSINTMTHSGNGGLGPRVTAEGFSWRGVAENVAVGQTSVGQVMRDWVNSPGHYANIMGAQYTHLGYGRAGNFWTQVFAA